MASRLGTRRVVGGRLTDEERELLLNNRSELIARFRLQWDQLQARIQPRPGRNARIVIPTRDNSGVRALR
jgi:hypothetical protein